MGAPLAFAALPLYVLLPEHYAATLGAPLAGLGLVLLAVRAGDAVVDPALGRGCDRVLAAGRVPALTLAAAAGALLTGGLAALLLPPAVVLQAGAAALLPWCAAALALTSLGYSALGVLHQAWGARLGPQPALQLQLASWREGLALAGVLAASVLPALLGVAALPAVAGLLLVLAWLGLRGVPLPPSGAAGRGGLRPEEPAVAGRPASPWRAPAFRALLAVYLGNGIASAVPATLVLFFIRDVLGADAQRPLLLGLYFLAAALSMPGWAWLAARVGLVRAWLAGMALAVACFVWAGALGPGDVAAFAAVCVGTGVALGADLTAPPALLVRVIARAGAHRRDEGLYFGWWTGATKLNLALAAGAALPLVAALGYQPGAAAGSGVAAGVAGAAGRWWAAGLTGTQALALVYAGLPCVLKALAALALWRGRRLIEPEELAR